MYVFCNDRDISTLNIILFYIFFIKINEIIYIHFSIILKREEGKKINTKLYSKYVNIKVNNKI